MKAHSRYQSSRFTLTYKVKHFLLPKLIHCVIVSFILVVLCAQSKQLSRLDSHFWLFIAAHAITMIFFCLASSLNPGYVSKESVKSFIDGFSKHNKEARLTESDASTTNHTIHLDDDYEDEDQDLFSSASEDDVFLRHDSTSSRTTYMSNQSAPPKLSYKNTEISFRKCNYCEIIQPLRAKHCEECGRCVRKYDHHCPWLGNCVGEKNHKFFWGLLFCGVLTTSWTLIETYRSFTSPPSHSPFEYLTLNFWLIAIFFLELVFLMVSGLLFCAHTYLMVSNQTSWEFMARSRITYLRDLGDENPFDSGIVRNCWQFMCNWKSRNWEHYFENLSSAAESCVTAVLNQQQGAAHFMKNCLDQEHNFSMSTVRYSKLGRRPSIEGEENGDFSRGSSPDICSINGPETSCKERITKPIRDDDESSSQSSETEIRNEVTLDLAQFRGEMDSGNGGSSDLNFSAV